MKFKSKVKDDKLKVKVKISSSDIIKEEYIDIFNKNSIRGFLKPNVTGKRIIEYTGPVAISLKEYLKRNLSKYDFFYLMVQILDLMNKVERYGLVTDNIVFDLRYVFINENTKEMQYIYIPASRNIMSADIAGFMENIAYEAEYEDEDIDYVAEFINFVNGLGTFDAVAIEQYISGEDELLAKRIAKNCYIHSYHTSEKQKKRSEENKEVNKVGHEDTDATELLNHYDDDGMTEIISDKDGDATELLNESKPEKSNEIKPCIVRAATGESISINKRVFRIGKERSYVDYYIDSDAISRKHADIITRGGRFFICDQNSTNHTYVDGEIIRSKDEVEVFDGSVIRLAEEEFTFCL